MRGFFAGLLIGALAAWFLASGRAGDPLPLAQPATPSNDSAAAERTGAVAAAKVQGSARTVAARREVGRSAPATPFAAGECGLRIGDGYVFGEEAVRAASDRSATYAWTSSDHC